MKKCLFVWESSLINVTLFQYLIWYLVSIFEKTGTPKVNFDFTRKVNSFFRYVSFNHIYIQLICGTIENNLSYSKEILSWSRGKKSLSTLLYYTSS